MAKWKEKHPDSDVTETIQFVADYVTEYLRFTYGGCTTTPNEFERGTSTNHQGFAALFNSCMQYLLDSGQSEWQVEHLIGEIHIHGQRGQRFYRSPFFVNHDYNRVSHLSSAIEYIVDVSLYEEFGILYVQPPK